MTWKRNVLVVANVTATSEELLTALKQRAEAGPSSFTLIVPATLFGGGREVAEDTLAGALEQLKGAGLEVAGAIASADPLEAVTDTWDPKKYDEVIVSTLPQRFSKWLHAGLPERIEKLTGAPVTHVVSQPRQAIEGGPAPAHEESPLGPLSVLGWGGHK